MKKLHQHIKGSTLDDPTAHREMHQNWSRRQFLANAGMAGLGTVLLQGLPFNASASLAPLGERDDRILVLLKLNGGNDGLNTIIPYSQNAYYTLRPDIHVPVNEQIVLDSKYSMPVEMQPLYSHWQEGNMAVIHNVNFHPYQYSNSHFIMSDAWSTGRRPGASNARSSGWMGRYLETVLPSYLQNPTPMPAALNIGAYSNLTFKAENFGQMELSLQNAEEFYELVKDGLFYPTDIFGNCPAEDEIHFIRTISNTALRYGSVIRDAYNKGTNEANYGNTAIYQGNELAEQLAIVARLIKGGLGTPVYHVQMEGYDTHDNQNKNNWHRNSLGDASTLIDSFLKDLGKRGWKDKVTVMVYSEFGRTKYETGEGISAGTQHGNISMMMMFGDSINGGTYGDTQDLSLYGNNLGDINNVTDFREIYATVLDDWFCAGTDLTNAVLYNPIDAGDTNLYARISNLFNSTCSESSTFGLLSNALILGHNPDPNNANIVEIKYAVKQPGDVTLTLEKEGQKWDLVNDYHPKAGSFTHKLDRTQYPLLTGECTCHIQAAGQRYSRIIQLF